MTSSPRLNHVSCAACLALLVALACPLMGQELQPRHLNTPPLPPDAHSSKPATPAQRQELMLEQSNTSGPASLLNRLTWTPIGPASLVTGGGLVSGRITGIAVDPTTSNTIFIAAAGGGVWKTTNGGTSWTSLTDGQKRLAMGSIAIAHTDHNRIYAGTGEANNAGDSDYGDGILVSTNGGTSWTLSNPGNVFSGNVIGQIAVDPTNEDVAYAAAGGYPQNGNWYVNEGIWKTTDGGTTWTNTTASVNSQMAWTAVVVDPNTPTTIYAAIGDIYNQQSVNGVYRSMDSGSTWSLLANSPQGTTTGRIALAISPAANSSGHHVLYVAVENPNTSGLGYFGRSDNADAATPTFTNLTSGTPNFLGGQGWYDIVVNVDSAGVVYAAGVENYNTGGTQNILRSTNLGVTWGDISIVNSVEPHTDCHAIAFDSSNRMLIGNDGGIYRYDSTVPSWTDLNSNLNTIQLEGIGLHPTSVNTVVGGSQDNGTELYNNNLQWTETDGGDGGLAQISQSNPSECYAIHPVGSFGPTAFFRKSTDGCSAWSSAVNNMGFSSENFYPPFVVDPTNGDHGLVGMNEVNETTDGATAWAQIGVSGDGGFDSSGSDIDSVALSPANNSNPQVVYVATGGAFGNTSQIFVTSNDGSSWTERDLPTCTQNGLTSEGCRVNQIVIDPNDGTGNTAFAVTSNFTASGKGHVYKTANMGAAWTDITDNLPNLPTWSVQVGTDAFRTLYVAQESGVYYSRFPYSSWSVMGSGLANAQGLDLELNDSLHLLGLATHGRGAWEIETIAPPFGSVGAAVDARTGSSNPVEQQDNLLVEGWAADPQMGAPVTQVQIQIGGNVMGNATLGGSRPDVEAAYGNNPAFLNSGWTFTIPANRVPLGTYQVVVLASDAQGLTTTIGTKTITVATARQWPPFGSEGPAVDSKTGSTTIPKTDNLLVTGWAADQQMGAPVSKVQILIDNVVVGTATLGISRPDVVTAKNDPFYLKSGWTFTYAASNISSGIHTVTAVATDSDNLSTTLTPARTITVP